MQRVVLPTFEKFASAIAQVYPRAVNDAWNRIITKFTAPSESLFFSDQLYGPLALPEIMEQLSLIAHSKASSSSKSNGSMESDLSSGDSDADAYVDPFSYRLHYMEVQSPLIQDGKELHAFWGNDSLMIQQRAINIVAGLEYLDAKTLRVEINGHVPRKGTISFLSV